MDGKCGYCDTLGNCVVNPPPYDTCTPCSDHSDCPAADSDGGYEPRIPGVCYFMLCLPHIKEGIDRYTGSASQWDGRYCTNYHGNYLEDVCFDNYFFESYQDPSEVNYCTRPQTTPLQGCINKYGSSITSGGCKDSYSTWCCGDGSIDSPPEECELDSDCGYGDWQQDPNNECKERREILECGSTCVCVGSDNYEYRNKPSCTSCTSNPYCSGVNRCGSSDGDVLYYNFHCDGSGNCVAQSTKGCRCDAEDTDGGKIYTIKGSCTDYTGCSNGDCQNTSYSDYCTDQSTLKEYYVSGSGDSSFCASEMFTCDSYDCSTGLSPTCSGAGTDTLTRQGDDYSCANGRCVVSGVKICENYVCDSTQACTSQFCAGDLYICYRSNLGSWVWGNSAESVETACNDGYDNDCDGKIDSADPDCPMPLHINTAIDVLNTPLPNVQITVDGDTKLTDNSGETSFSISRGSHSISAPLTVDSRPFSHFWDHDANQDCVQDDPYDTSDNPYTFTMAGCERNITAWYKVFTHFEDSNGNPGTIDYVGSTISGYLLREDDKPLHYSTGATVSLEYYDGSWHSIGTATTSPTTGYFSLNWPCVSGATKIRASFTDTSWYYVSSTAVKDITCTFQPTSSIYITSLYPPRKVVNPGESFTLTITLFNNLSSDINSLKLKGVNDSRKIVNMNFSSCSPKEMNNFKKKTSQSFTITVNSTGKALTSTIIPIIHALMDNHPVEIRPGYPIMNLSLSKKEVDIGSSEKIRLTISPFDMLTNSYLSLAKLDDVKLYFYKFEEGENTLNLIYERNLKSSQFDFTLEDIGIKGVTNPEACGYYVVIVTGKYRNLVGNDAIGLLVSGCLLG